MKKANTFKGLAAAFGSLAAVCLFMTALAWDRAGDINLKLGVNKGNSDAASVGAYPSAFGSRDEMLEAESKYTIQCEEEGSVLLKNNGALPFSNEIKNVTLFGYASVNPAYHGGSGGPANTGTSLYDALKGAGYNINDTVFNAIKNGQTLKRGNKEIAEAPVSVYKASDMAGYKDAAIVTICRYGGEANDMDVVDNYGVRELCLHDSEKEMLNFVKSQGFGKVIVLLNTGYAMEVGWFDEYGVDAALWIGFPGESGMIGVANMLKGEASPTGRLVDTYAKNSLSSAAMQNFGDFVFQDLEDQGQYHKEYVVYAENIYVGYKYYETRYMDQVLGRRNATGNYGVYESKDNKWDYDSEMSYTFGYGKTYTEFEQKVTEITWDKTNHKVIAKGTSKNVGTTYQGAVKDTVELYVSLPWEVGMAEKSAIQIIGFDKTDAIKPGETANWEIEVNDYLFATYDEDETNGADSTKKGCYVFDQGDYYFSIGYDAHDALNNVLASMPGSIVGMTDGRGNTVTGDSTKCVKDTLAAKDNTSYAKSVTGEVVSNQFPEVNLNNYEPDEITYMTRGDWSTFPKTYDNLTTAKDGSGYIAKVMKTLSDPYVAPEAEKSKTYNHDTEVTIKFYELHDIEYDDPKWDTFIDQLSVAQLYNIPGEKMANDAIEQVGYPQNTSGDGPDGLQSGGKLHVAETLACSTYNTELLELRGKFLAEDGKWNGLNAVYGGGANLHRTPYAGRNFEYYSEDSTMSYIMGRVQGAAMSENGMIGMFKHFCGNDQETNRHGVSTWMTEQTLRQGDLRGFEGALTDGGSLGNMSAYNRLGAEPTASYKSLMTTVLRDEWGFKGISITDSSKDAQTYIFTGAAIEAGTDQFNNDAGRCTEVKKYILGRDGFIWGKTREIAKHFFYAYSRSFLINGLGADTVVKSKTPWWQPTVIGIDCVVGGLALASVAGYVIFTFVKKEGN